MNAQDIIVTLESDMLQVLVILLLLVLIASGMLLFNTLKLHLSAAQRAELDDIANKSLLYAFTRVTDAAPAKTAEAALSAGQTQYAVVDVASGYAKDRFAPALKRSANMPDVNDPSVDEQLRGLMLRQLPVSATRLTTPAVTLTQPEKIA